MVEFSNLFNEIMIQGSFVDWLSPKNTTMENCQIAGQSPYLANNLVAEEKWVGKAKYVMRWGKICDHD